MNTKEDERKSGCTNTLQTDSWNFVALDKYPRDAKFLYGHTLCLKHTTTLVGKLKSVFLIDAAHMKGNLGRAVFGTWGQDANWSIVCVALSVFFHNEGHKK